MAEEKKHRFWNIFARKKGGGSDVRIEELPEQPENDEVVIEPEDEPRPRRRPMPAPPPGSGKCCS